MLNEGFTREYSYNIAVDVGSVPDAAADSHGSCPLPAWFVAEHDAWDEVSGLAGQSPQRAAAATGSAPIRVFAAEHEPLVIRGLRALFEAEPDFELVGHVDRDSAVLDRIAAAAPDVVVINLNLPRGGGLAVVEALQRAGSAVRPILLATQLDEQEFLRARRFGVRGVVLKTMPSNLLLQCIRTVHGGEEFIEKETVMKALSALARRDVAVGPRGEALTERERAVVELAAAGLSTEQIAGRLGVGAGTVKSHLHNIYEKLGVRSRFALMRLVQLA